MRDAAGAWVSGAGRGGEEDEEEEEEGGGEEEEEEAGLSPPVRSLPPGLACCGAAGPEGGFGAVSGSFGAQHPPPQPRQPEADPVPQRLTGSLWGGGLG